MSSLKKVVIIDPSAFSTLYNESLVSALKPHCEVTYLTRSPRAGEEVSRRGIPFFSRFSESLKKRGWPHKLVQIVKVVEYMGDLYRLGGYLRKNQVSHLHVQWMIFPILESLFYRRWASRCKLVFTLHDSDFFHGNPSSRLQSWGYLEGLKAFHRIIVHQESAREKLLARGFSEDRVDVRPHGVLTPYFEKWKEVKGATPRPLRRQILFFGQIRPYKGVDVLIEAYAKIPKEVREKWQLKISGYCHFDSSELTRLCENLGLSLDEEVKFDFRYLDRDEVGPLIGQAEVLVFPYRNIDSSGVFFSVLPFEKVIVASQLGAFAEAIENGKNGVLVRPEAPFELATVLQKLMEDDSLRESIRRQAKGLVQSKYNWNSIGELTYETYLSS